VFVVRNLAVAPDCVRLVFQHGVEFVSFALLSASSSEKITAAIASLTSVSAIPSLPSALVAALETSQQ